MNGLNRITINPAEMGGLPCVRHLDIPVSTIIRLLEQGESPGEILAACPGLEPEDIDQARMFAAAIRDQDLRPAEP